MFVDIIRAWKDPEYRQSLSAAERGMVPAHPAGLTELTEDEIRAVSGAGGKGEDGAEGRGGGNGGTGGSSSGGNSGKKKSKDGGAGYGTDVQSDTGDMDGDEPIA